MQSNLWHQAFPCGGCFQGRDCCHSHRPAALERTDGEWERRQARSLLSFPGKEWEGEQRAYDALRWARQGGALHQKLRRSETRAWWEGGWASINAGPISDARATWRGFKNNYASDAKNLNPSPSKKSSPIIPSHHKGLFKSKFRKVTKCEQITAVWWFGT